MRDKVSAEAAAVAEAATGEANIGSSDWEVLAGAWERFVFSGRSACSPRVPMTEAASREERRRWTEGGLLNPSRDVFLERGGGETAEMASPNDTAAELLLMLLGVFAREYGWATKRTFEFDGDGDAACWAACSAESEGVASLRTVREDRE